MPFQQLSINHLELKREFKTKKLKGVILGSLRGFKNGDGEKTESDKRQKRGKWRGEASGNRLAQRHARVRCATECEEVKDEGIRKFLRYVCLSLIVRVRWQPARWSVNPEGVSFSNKLLPAACCRVLPWWWRY
jgi:hypothetical protein